MVDAATDVVSITMSAMALEKRTIFARDDYGWSALVMMFESCLMRRKP